MKKCPFCSEEIQDSANKCRHCGEWLESQPSVLQHSSPVAENYSAQQTVPPSPVSTPQADIATIRYAGFWVRWAANFIDGVIVTLLSVAFSVVFFLVIAFFSTDSNSEAVTGLFQLIVWGISFGYFITLTYKKEATWGKMALGLRVIPSEKEKLSLGQVVLRETIGKIVSGLIFGIGYIMVAFTEKKQGLHDKIASTYVVYKDPTKKNNAWIIVAIIAAVFVFIAVIGILASIVLVSLSSARDKAKTAAYKAEVVSLVPSMLLACDERNIAVSDLGSPKYFDTTVAYKTLIQNCGPKSPGSFSITVKENEEVGSNSAVCTEEGCTFK